jgi:hypothetical protein
MGPINVSSPYFQNSYINWTQMSRLSPKMETESNLRNVVLNKEQENG